MQTWLVIVPVGSGLLAVVQTPRLSFRIFNPITQSEKFDKQGSYIRRYVPELANMPEKYIHAPWLAPPEVLAGLGSTLAITTQHPSWILKSLESGHWPPLR